VHAAQLLGCHADPRTTPHYDRARGKLARYDVHFLTAYIAGVSNSPASRAGSLTTYTRPRGTQGAEIEGRHLQEAGLTARPVQTSASSINRAGSVVHQLRLDIRAWRGQASQYP